MAATLTSTYFRPSSGMNPDLGERYAKNRFSLIRQLKYSEKNEKSLDMALFLNGLPIVTMETEEQPHRSGGDRRGETVSDRSGSARAAVQIRAVSGALCSR